MRCPFQAPHDNNQYISLRGRLLLQYLHSFRKDQLRVNPPAGQEPYLAIVSVPFIQPLEGDALPVADPVVGKVAEQDGPCTCRDSGHIGGCVQGLAQEQVGLAFPQARLPQVLVVQVLQLADCPDAAVIKDPDRIPAVRGLQAVIEVDQLISSDRCRTGCRDPDLGSGCLLKDAGRLLAAVADKEGFLFLRADTACELFGDVLLQVERGIVQELLGYLDEGTDLMDVDLLLCEDVVALAVRGSLIDQGQDPSSPAGGRRSRT